MNMLKIVLDLFSNADLIVVGDSPMLSEVSIEDVTGDGDNEIVNATWTSEEGDFSIKFTEEGLLNGKWVNGSFLAIDSEGDEVEVTFFDLVKKSYVAVSPEGVAS
jgi:hypothetical protein